MLNKKIVKYLIFIVGLLAVGYPISVWFNSANLVWDKIVLFDIFPVLGLIGFSLMWLHIVAGAFRKRLSNYFDFSTFIHISSTVVLLMLILHPAVFLLALAVNNWGSVFSYIGNEREYFIWIAIVAWVIFILYDVFKKFKTRKFFVKHWTLMRFISTLGFFLILVHSLGIGRDLQTGPLRSVWIFYGVTAGLATIYNYGGALIFKKRAT